MKTNYKQSQAAPHAKPISVPLMILLAILL